MGTKSTGTSSYRNALYEYELTFGATLAERTSQLFIVAKTETLTTVSAESPSIRGGAFYAKRPIASPEQFVIG